MHISAQKYHSLCFLTHRLCLNKNKPTGGFALPTHWGKATGKCWRKLLWTEDLRRHSLRLFLRSMAVLGVQRWVWHPFLRKRWSNALSRRNERLPSTIRRECLCWPRASWPTMSSEPRWARYTWRNLMLKITRSSRLGVFAEEVQEGFGGSAEDQVCGDREEQHDHHPLPEQISLPGQNENYLSNLHQKSVLWGHVSLNCKCKLRP